MSALFRGDVAKKKVEEEGEKKSWRAKDRGTDDGKLGVAIARKGRGSRLQIPIPAGPSTMYICPLFPANVEKRAYWQEHPGLRGRVAHTPRAAPQHQVDLVQGERGVGGGA